MGISEEDLQKMQDRIREKAGKPVFNPYSHKSRPTVANVHPLQTNATIKPVAIKTGYFCFPVVPIGKPRMTQRDKWLNPPRPAVAKYYVFKDILSYLAAKEGFVLPDTFRATFTIPFPKSYSKKKCDLLDGKPHQLKPDVDNCCKSLLDCLKKQDCTVWDVRVTKVWGYQGKIEISPL